MRFDQTWWRIGRVSRTGDLAGIYVAWHNRQNFYAAS
jgi:hypothetical protein